MLKIDLHTHTNASDGKLSVHQLIRKAIDHNIDVIAITDHDTVDALIECEKDVEQGIQIIPGIELSAEKEMSIHILGYYIDIHNKDLITELDRKRMKREKEILQVISKLIENGVEISEDKVLKEEKALTMSAIVAYLRKAGYSDSCQDTYEKYLNKGACAYVPKTRFTPKRAIELINGAKGIPVLAHPNKFDIPREEVKLLIEELVQYGLKGIEVYAKGMQDAEYYLELCREFNLFATGGSDFHKEGDCLGQWNDGVQIPLGARMRQGTFFVLDKIERE